MRDLSVLLKEFHACFEIPDAKTWPELIPRMLCVREEMNELREEFHRSKQMVEFDLMPKESIEGHRVRLSGKEVPVAKEAVDLVYTIVSMFVAAGWDFEAAFEEVHRSNMSKGTFVKVSNPDNPCEPISRFHFEKTAEGKVVKPDTYSPADITPHVQPMNPVSEEHWAQQQEKFSDFK